MNSKDFDIILNNRVEQIKTILASKGKEYATEDRLYNFKRAAEIMRVTPEQALLGMLMKHLVSVIDLVEGRLEATSYMINEKLGDSINYHVLLEALLVEKMEDPK